MAYDETIMEIEKDLGSFRYVGEILATIRNHELSSVTEAVEHYYKLWQITEGLTDEYLQRKEDENVELSPGGYGHTTVRGKKNDFDIDAVIESLRNQERYIEEILTELKKKYPKRFPRNNRFGQTLKPKP